MQPSQLNPDDWQPPTNQPWSGYEVLDFLGQWPSALVARDRYIASLAADGIIRETIPTDALLLADAHGDDQTLTRICGHPIRPVASPWPVGDDGEPWSFLAQIDFRASRDLIDFDLPDDIMIVFVHPEFFEGVWEDRYRIDWFSADADGLALDESGANPQPMARVGVRYRTVDINSAEDFADLYSNWKNNPDAPTGGADSPIGENYNLYAFCRSRCCKVGGVPMFFGINRALSAQDIESAIPGRYFASLVEITELESGEDWIDATGNRITCERNSPYFIFRDGYSMYFSLADNGETVCTFEMG